MIKINTSYQNLVNQRILATNTKDLQRSMERLSTGAKINHAADDAAGIFINSGLSADISGEKSANETTQLAMNFIGIANGALTTISENLMRMNTIAIQACNDALSDMGRIMLQTEMEALTEDIVNTIGNAKFDGVSTLVNTGEMPVIIGGGGGGGGGNVTIGTVTSTTQFIDEVTSKTKSELIALGCVECTAENLASGTKFYIESVADLQALATAVNAGNTCEGKTFTLADDIDLTAIAWNAIGTSTNHFKGTFDGNYHEIKNLTINKSSYDYQGLFGYVEDATLKNVAFRNASVTGKDNVGALVGYAYSASGRGGIQNVWGTGNVTGTNNVGGLIGQYSSSAEITKVNSGMMVTGTTNAGGVVGQLSGTLKKSMASGNITGTGYSITNLGGLVGNLSGSIQNCGASGTVRTGSHIGGLVGYISSGSVSYSFATGAAQGTTDTGGLIGYAVLATVSKCFASGNITGGTYNSGGLIGSIDNGSVSNSHSSSTVGGTSVNNGGLIGAGGTADTTVSVTSSWATGNVSGGDYSGGLAGLMIGAFTVSKSYATGNVNLTDTGSYAGGLIGGVFPSGHNNSITNCYSCGDVSANSCVGGLIGFLANGTFSTPTLTITNSYTCSNVYTKNAGYLGYVIGSQIAQQYVDFENVYYSTSAEQIQTTYMDAEHFFEDHSNHVIGGTYMDGLNSWCINFPIGQDASLFAYQSSFSGWSASVWDFSGSTPQLKLNDIDWDVNTWDLTESNPRLKRRITEVTPDSDPDPEPEPIVVSDGLIRIQVGIDSTENSAVYYDPRIGLDLTDLNVNDKETAGTTLGKVQALLNVVTTKESYVGTLLNRLEGITTLQQVYIENTSSARSTIKDTDYSKEISNLTKAQILQQISLSVLSQSQNTEGRIILGLIK